MKNKKELLADFILEHLQDDIVKLALKSHHDNVIPIRTAIQQIASRQRIRFKLPSWYNNPYLSLPNHLPLEQCSSELTANYKRQLLKGDCLIDLTGGLGIDCSFLAKNFKEVTYVEQQAELCELAKKNFQELGLPHIEVVNQDATNFLNRTDVVDALFIDPARRKKSGQKAVLLEDCTPNLLEIQLELRKKAKTTLIKLSPMLDISQALSKLIAISEVHIVGVKNECKELLFIMSQEKTKNSPVFICSNLSEQVTTTFFFKKEEETTACCIFCKSIGTYLYEPNVTILKAGAYKLIGEKYNLEKLHINTHLYTSNNYEKDFPGRIFKVTDVITMNKKLLKKAFKGKTKANVATRNFPLKVDALKKKLNLKDGGDLYLFGVTAIANQHLLLLTEKIS